MPTHRLISADSHVVETPEIFEPVAKRLGREPPKMVNTEDRGWVLDTGFGRIYQPGHSATAGLVPQTPEHDAQERSGYARASLTDIKARLADMDQDGVEAEVLFPTAMGGFLSMQSEIEVTKSLLASYNDWLTNYCSESAGRLFPLACIQVEDLDAAVVEMERTKKMGHVGIVIPFNSPYHRPYTDPAYDKLWAAADAMSMPATFHAAFGSDPRNNPEAFQRHGLGYTLLYVGAAITISDLILGGACDRFPNIRFVATEFETGWLSHFLTRMDWRQFRREDRSKIKMEFSDYWHRNFYATFEDDEIGIRTRDGIGVESLMWASDYPHGDSVWPNSQATIERIMSDCTPEERYAMTVKNVVELYDLPIEV